MTQVVPERAKLLLYEQSHVGIADHPFDNTKLVVSNNEFWVSKKANEFVEWFCERKHTHGQSSPCFTIKFDKNGSPFKGVEFSSNNLGYARSDEIVAEPGDIIYYYRVVARGKHDLDPGGGVKP
jgi:hypothetical protein